jgi:hypothetical protein
MYMGFSIFVREEEDHIPYPSPLPPPNTTIITTTTMNLSKPSRTIEKTQNLIILYIFKKKPKSKKKKR